MKRQDDLFSGLQTLIRWTASITVFVCTRRVGARNMRHIGASPASNGHFQLQKLNRSEPPDVAIGASMAAAICAKK
jgi:hypothetical protein